MLVSLHPFSLDGQAWETYSRLGRAASARGYWVIIPNGSQPGPRWSVPGGLDTGIDDIGWIDALLVELSKTVCVDTERVFAAGFSAGAAMAVGLSCELPWRFNAIVASGGANLTTTCSNQGGVDALIVHGSSDPIAPLTGSEVIFAPPLGLKLSDTVESFAQRNGCTDSNKFATTPTIDTTKFGCSNHRLEYWQMNGSGHTWAGADTLFDFVVGPTDSSFSATEVTIEFFEASVSAT